MADLKFDYEKKLLTIEPEDAVFRALLVAAPPAPLALGTVELGDFVARGGERGFARDSARWASLRAHCPTLDRLCRLEDLEPVPPGPTSRASPGPSRPSCASPPASPPRPSRIATGLLAGADFRGYVEIPFSLEGGAAGELASVLRARGGGAPGTVNGIRSVLEAKRHPRWNVDLKPAVAKEFRRILGKPGPDNPGAFEAFDLHHGGTKAGPDRRVRGGPRVYPKHRRRRQGEARDFQLRRRRFEPGS